MGTELETLKYNEIFKCKVKILTDEELSLYLVIQINDVAVQSKSLLKYKQYDEEFRCFENFPSKLFSNKGNTYIVSKNMLITKYDININKTHISVYINNDLLKINIDLRKIIALLFINNENPKVYDNVNYIDYNVHNLNVNNLVWDRMSCMCTSLNFNLPIDDIFTQMIESENFYDHGSASKMSGKNKNEREYPFYYKMPNIINLKIYQISNTTSEIVRNNELRLLSKCLGLKIPRELYVSKIDGINTENNINIYDCMLRGEVFRYFNKLPWYLISNKNRVYSIAKQFIKSNFITDMRDFTEKKYVKHKITNGELGRKSELDLHNHVAVLFIKNPHKSTSVSFLPSVINTTQIYPENLMFTGYSIKNLPREPLQLEHFQNIEFDLDLLEKNIYESLNLEPVTEKRNNNKIDFTESLPNEIWYSFEKCSDSKLQKYKNHYASNLGRIRNGNKLYVYNNENIILDGYSTSLRIARVIAIVNGIKNPENKSTIDHIDSDCTNNCVENLRWATQSENNYNTNTLLKRSQKILYKHIDSKVVNVAHRGVNKLSEYLGCSAKNIKIYSDSKKVMHIKTDNTDTLNIVFKYITNEEYDECMKTNKYVDNELFFDDDNFNINCDLCEEYTFILPNRKYKSEHEFKYVDDELYQYNEKQQKFIRY